MTEAQLLAAAFAFSFLLSLATWIISKFASTSKRCKVFCKIFPLGGHDFSQAGTVFLLLYSVVEILEFFQL